MTAPLMEWVEREAASPDKGRARFLELAAKQVAVARGLGYAGVYLAGQRNAGEIDAILAMADAYGPDDWRALAADVSLAEPGAHRLFEADGDAHRIGPAHRPQATVAPDGADGLSRQPLRPRPRVRAELDGFDVGRSFYQRVEAAGLGVRCMSWSRRPSHPLFGCHDCGDCSLPDIAYLCPESQCVKNQRNGPCGGSLGGECESPGKPCIWAAAFERLDPYGEAMTSSTGRRSSRTTRCAARAPGGTRSSAVTTSGTA